MSKDQPHFSKVENNSTPPVDQNPLVVELKAKLQARESIIEKQNKLIADLHLQIEKFSDKPNKQDIVAKLKNKLEISKGVLLQKLQEFKSFLVENQTVLLASSVVGLGGIAGMQSIVNQNFQQQIDLNSDLNRLTDEKMLDSMETKAERKEQEFNDKIQKLQQEIQELKNKQTSTLLPQNSNQNQNSKVPQVTLPQNSNQKEFNPQKFQELKEPLISKPSLDPEIPAPTVNPEIFPNSKTPTPIEPQLTVVPAPITPLTPTLQEK